ncbi:peptidoglycan-binding protein [Pelagibacterium mangrovi]|uniref:peptidoglycan-binding protein n=1 Tax=Pelagibacterium mangrovi TaxID=3119828 RepID=UPI002FCA69B1
MRNELVALLDQVEDQVASVQSTRVRHEPASPIPTPLPTDRHSEALRSVRQAVSRLADRNSDDRPVMRESVVDAINQIRARQTGAARPIATAPAAASKSELAGFAQALDAMGERIGRFESRIAEQIEALGGDKDISGQIAQLSEVIELLAGAVGETGQIARIEAQIGNLAEMVVAERSNGHDATAERVEELTSTVEKLLAHQIETSGQNAQQVARSEDRQNQTMAMIEQSVRNIYDRIDALETQTQSSADIDRLSRDMAALTEAVSQKSEPEALLVRIDALGDRIAMIEAPSRDDAALLAESVSALRGVIVETIEPRFAQIEDRIEGLSAANSPVSIEPVEAQLRQIARRVDETSTQLKVMAAMEPPAAPAPLDLQALADLIAEKSVSHAPAPTNADGVEKADLDALEQRLAALFARSGETQAEPANLAGMRSSIAQVDSRIARLEAMLNSKPASSSVATTLAAAPARPRRKPDDAMPLDPTTGQTRTIPEPVPAEPEVEETLLDKQVEAAEAKPFSIDPESIDRPAKPQSSLNTERSPFATTTPEPAKPEPTLGIPATTRASFIEAARRSARQPETENEEEPRSLIGRALARFQRSEAEAVENTESLVSDAPSPEPDAEPRFEEGEDTSETPSFFARNRRALLLGTALVVVIAMAVPLVAGRLLPARPTAVESAQAPAPTETSASEIGMADEPEIAEPDIEVSADSSDDANDTGDLVSNVRLIEQQPRLTAARVDGSAFASSPTVDPIQTAAIGTAAGYAAVDAPIDTAAALDLPEATVPEGIEPLELKLSAEAGDRFAQFEVGAILSEGTLVEQDFAQAAAWYERSAAQGFAPAQYRLGSLYEGGRGVERDLEMARLWYQRAAEAGNRMSMHNLASLYAGGELDAQDFEAAAHWFEQAAARGLTDSQFNLGMLHARGLGVEQDFEQSYIWFSLAARSGDQDAATSRDDVARSLEAETIQRLDNRIETWVPAEIDLAANFAPIGTWDETFDPGPAIANQDVILRVQLLLGKLGYDIGTPDGISGPKTREAIAEFERATGMTESGAINPRLLAVLGSQPV